MSLPMTRPYKHPKTGMYWVRKVVPQELRPLVGKGELKRSLKTKDPSEARQVAPAVIAEFEQVITSARMGQQYSRGDVDALAGEYFRRRRAEIVAQARKEHWSEERFEAERDNHDLIQDTANHPDDERAAVLSWALPIAESLLKRHGAFAPPVFKEALAAAVYRQEREAINTAWDDYFHRHTSVPAEEAAPPVFRPPVARSITSLFRQYAEAKELRARTVDDWGKMIAHFEDWLKGKPADKVTPQDILRYGDELREGKGLSQRKLSAKRVNEGYLAVIRSTYAWAVSRSFVPANPAHGVKVETPRSETGPKRRGYTREEVSQILKAARFQTTAYKRWVPWLLAFTGARVSEILNAKKGDIGQTEGVWYINIREQGEGESGRELKNTWSTRCVPLHPALLKEGFLAYTDSLPDGEHIFPGTWKDKHGDRTKTPANRLRDWLNSIRPPEVGVAPNHSFRHWLINECRRAKIDPDFQRQLTGHSTKDAHGRYGPGDVPELMEALAQIGSPL